jgi:bifunctional DNA-binding transcriptional regulator/antitoxin component of YhaV-PrlF toxin-antitoxin module
MTTMRAKVSGSGRLSIPVQLRRAVGLENGGDVLVDLDGKAIRIRTVDQVVAQAQEISRRLLRGKKGVSVDDFLAERRREAERE